MSGWFGNVAHALSVPRRHSCRRLGVGRDEFRPGRLKVLMLTRMDTVLPMYLTAAEAVSGWS